VILAARRRRIEGIDEELLARLYEARQIERLNSAQPPRRAAA
jgi:hypothetical protein